MQKIPNNGTHSIVGVTVYCCNAIFIQKTTHTHTTTHTHYYYYTHTHYTHTTNYTTLHYTTLHYTHLVNKFVDCSIRVVYL